MGLRIFNLFIFAAIGGLFAISCKKSDPAPLGAQVNAKFLAGEKGASKKWKLRELNYDAGGTNVGTATLPGCFLDNIYTFTNNDSQDYAATEGVSKCGGSTSDAIESGTWAFTLDGLTLNIEVDDVSTPNGLFASAIFYETDSTGTVLTDAYNGGYVPYPAFVKKIDDNNLVLELNITRGTSKVKYTLTFTPA
jgi:hypothetical protein